MFSIKCSISLICPFGPTCLVLSNSSLSKLEDNCSTELKNLKKWCSVNKLNINPEKSAVVLIPLKFNLQTGKFDVTYNNPI